MGLKVDENHCSEEQREGMVTADTECGSNRINAGLKIWTLEFKAQFHINWLCSVFQSKSIY